MFNLSVGGQSIVLIKIYIIYEKDNGLQYFYGRSIKHNKINDSITFMIFIIDIKFYDIIKD